MLLAIDPAVGATIGDTPSATVEGHPPDRGHLPALDGLRGVAILLVLLTHFIGLPLDGSRNGVDDLVEIVTRAGWTGVDLFFVISGFLITGILLDTRDEPRRWTRFFARRALRIFPLYYGVLFVVIVVPRFFGWTEPDYLTLRDHQAWYWLYGVNFINILTHGAATPLNTVHFWSLSIEEQFYIFWPFVVWAMRPAGLMRLAVAVFVLGLAARIWLAWADPFHFMATGYTFTLTRLDGLTMGAVLAVLARRPGGLMAWRGWAKVAGGVGAVALLVTGIVRGGIDYTDPVISTVGLPVIAVTCGALLVLVLTALPSTRLSSFFCAGWLRSWGKYSYGIYVFHFLVIGAMQWKLRFWERGSAWAGGSRLPGVLLMAAGATVITLVVAWVSYQVYEKPFLRLKRFFERSGREKSFQPRRGLQAIVEGDEFAR